MSKRANIIIEQGTTFSIIYELVDDYEEPLNVSDYQARGQMRKHHASNSYTDFTCSLITGQLTISLTAEQTAQLGAIRHVYDIELVDTVANTVTRIVEGFVTVTPEVTKVWQ